MACGGARPQPTGAPLAGAKGTPKHKLIGYWEGYSNVRAPTPLRDVSPEWDVVIATFATPMKGSTALLHFAPPAVLGDEKFKADVAYLQGLGKKVLISLGGGGQVVTINTPQDLHDFVTSVTEIVEKYGFDGVDLDIETPSLLIDAGDTDFRKPTTASIVNLITAMRQMREHFGAKFMIGEVPEAAQAQSGMQVYWRAVWEFFGGDLRDAGYFVVCGRAGLQHAAAGGVGRELLFPGECGLSCGAVGDVGAWVSGGGR